MLKKKINYRLASRPILQKPVCECVSEIWILLLHLWTEVTVRKL